MGFPETKTDDLRKQRNARITRNVGNLLIDDTLDEIESLFNSGEISERLKKELIWKLNTRIGDRQKALKMVGGLSLQEAHDWAQKQHEDGIITNEQHVFIYEWLECPTNQEDLKKAETRRENLAIKAILKNHLNGSSTFEETVSHLAKLQELNIGLLITSMPI